MKVMGITANRSWKFVAGLAFLTSSFATIAVRAQAPYLLPYTINTVAGGNPLTTVGAACAGGVGIAFDTLGDGCQASSASVSTNTNIHDVGVDPVGNLYFIDIGSNTILRKIDARTGIVNVLAGSNTLTTVCPATSGDIDAFGDGCPANDGKGNVTNPNTYLQGTSRGIAVGKNGDVYIADYTNSLVHKVSASTGFMTLVAGALGSGATPNKVKGVKGFSGDGGPAAGTAGLSAPRGVAVDLAGNVYIADSGNDIVRMVSASTGFISTIAGIQSNGTSLNFSGDGGPATKATLVGPEDVEVDANGNIFIADFTNARVRVIYAGGAAVAKLISLTSGAGAQPGSIYTIMGGGAGTYVAGTQVLATSIIIGGPRKIALDARGNVYLADGTGDVVWFLDATTGYMRVIAGIYAATSGSTCTTTNAVGDNCQATLATLSPASNMGVGVGPQGDVYISDSGDARLRKVSINTSFPAVSAGNSLAQTLVVHFAVSDTQAASSPFAITGGPDFSVNNSATSCNLNTDGTTDCAISVVFTPTLPGRDFATLVIKSAAGLTTDLSLSGVGMASSVAFDPGTTTLLASGFSSPAGTAMDASGNIYVADTGNNRVLRYSGTTASLIAGTGTLGYSGDGAAATSAKLAGPKAVTVTPDGAIYIADTGNNVIRRIDPISGFISTIGGAGAHCATQDDSLGDGCPATNATFSAPAGLASDSLGNVYVSDTGNNIIREIGTTGYVFTVAGGTTHCPTIIDASGNYVSGATDTFGDGCGPTLATFKSPTALRIDASRNLYIADTGNNEVRELVAATNLMSAVAGTGQAGGSGNGGSATTAQVNGPTGIALDAAGNLYIADTGNHVVRMVNSGTINSVVGNLGSSGTGIVPGSAAGVLLNLPAAVAVSGTGNLWVVDSGNNRLLALDRTSVSWNFGRTNVGASSPTTIFQQTSTGSATASLGYPLSVNTGSATVFSLTPSGPNGCSSSQSLILTLAPGAICNYAAQFSPIAVGTVSATYTESNATTVNSPAPSITLSGAGAVLTGTTLTTAVTTPATGNPQYSIPFVVTATLHPALCDPTAPDCSAAGTITFYVGGTQAGLPVAVAQVGLPVAVKNTSSTSSNVITASQTINGLSVTTAAVTHTVFAVYSGDTYYASSTSSTSSISVAQGSTTTVVSANPSSGLQFSDLTLTAQVTSTTTTVPTGNITFYAGSALLGTVSVDGTTGIAAFPDVLTYLVSTDPTLNGNITHRPQSFGLVAGTYTITAIYSGDSNYAVSTSAPSSLVIKANAPGFTLALCNVTNVFTACTPPSIGTAQGSTASAQVLVNPANTLSGTLTFACTNLPANTDCTFSATPSATEIAGTTLSFTPVSGVPVQQSLTVTIWTDMNPGVIPPNGALQFPKLFPRSGPALAAMLGWPMLLCGFTLAIGFRKRLRNSPLLTVLAFIALSGGALVMSGCGGNKTSSGLTPVGSNYVVTLTVTGPNGLVQTMPITFSVGPGVAGQS